MWKNIEQVANKNHVYPKQHDIIQRFGLSSFLKWGTQIYIVSKVEDVWRKIFQRL